MKKFLKALARFFTFLIILYIILLIPDCQSSDIHKASENPYIWNKDSLWNTLEKRYDLAKSFSQEDLDSNISILKNRAEILLANLQNDSVPKTATNYSELLYNYFELAPFIAASKEHEWFVDYYNRSRVHIKKESLSWDINSPIFRNRIYEILYGMRAAVEEVLLQSENLNFHPVLNVENIESELPSTEILGIKVHSGDLLVSRGGAEVSALISRGNDYPGNFSHIALVYVDEKSKPHFIEAHIERGVAIANLEEYIKDKKLRFMVLRLRPHHEAIQKDPLLPHKAAKYAYDDAKKRHIPYDFKMDFYNQDAMFCSEVASYTYKKEGVQLWQSVSTISNQGVVNWLHTFGVENFVTQMPSDLEYDPQLAVVGEWRDPETLFKDHIDNAVIDVMIELAEKDFEVDYTIWMLPYARLVKSYCWVQNQFGYEGLIPEGMSATQALKNLTFEELHQNIKKKTEAKIEQFRNDKKYIPPYWKMIDMARESYEEIFN